jgi:tetratricopeptide (TPR) repeat protein
MIKLPFTFIADDSPETITCFQKLNVQHPPGYPLNTMIGKIFSLIPAGNPMMRGNLTSCFFHILTSMILFLIVLKIFKDEKDKFIVRMTGVFAVIFYLFSNTAFLQATSAKGSIYTLHSFLTAVIFFSLLKMNKETGFLYLMAFSFGLSLTNHWPSAVVMLPGIIFYLYAAGIKFNKRNAFYPILFFILGLTPFLFLFIRSYTVPDAFWPVKNFGDFLWMFGRKQYASIDAAHTINDAIKFFKYLFFDVLPEQYPFYLAFLFLPGIVFSYKRNKIFCLASLLVVVCMLFGIASVNVMREKMEWVVKPYLTFIYAFIAIFVSFVFFEISKVIKNPKTNKIVSVSLFIFLFVFLYKNCPDYSKYYLAYDYVQNAFKTLPEKSVFLAEGDLNVSGGMYAANVENKNVVLVIPSLLNHKWYRNALRKNLNVEDEFKDYKNCIKNLVLSNADRKIYFSNTFTKKWMDFNFVQRGIVNEILIEGSNSGKVYNHYLNFLVYSYRGAFDDVLYDEATRTFVLDNFGRSWFNAGKIFEDRNENMNALYYFTRAFNFYKDDVLAYKIGLYYFDMEEMEKCLYYFKEAVKINKKNISAYKGLVAVGAVKNDYNLMRKYAKEILKYDKNDRDAIKLLNGIGR